MAVLAVAAYVLIGRSVSIEFYRILDERTIAVQVVTGDQTWTRVAWVRETDSTVEIAVTSVSAPLPMTSIGKPLVLTINLQHPLGNRIVIDSDGNRRVQLGEWPSHFELK